MSLSHQFNLAPANMMPASRFKRAYRLIESMPELRTSDNDHLLRILFIDAYENQQHFLLDIFRSLIERTHTHGITPLHLPAILFSDIAAQGEMPFFTYIRGFFQCQRDSETIINNLVSLPLGPR